MRAKLLIVIVASFMAGAGIALALKLSRGWPEGGATRMIGRAAIGGPFTLTDHTGRRVSEKDFAGRYLLIYFGFTNCPDMCPASLQVMSAALEKIGDKSQRVTPILISLDPERDTPAELARYVSNFHPRLIALTGSAAEIAAVAKAYRVYYTRAKDERSTAGYTVDHASLVYLMDGQGEYVAHFPHGTTPSAMAERLIKLL